MPVPGAAVRMGLCCGHQSGGDDELLVFTEPRAPIVKKLFRKVDVTPDLARLVQAVDAILRNDPDIRDVSWEDG